MKKRKERVGLVFRSIHLLNNAFDGHEVGFELKSSGFALWSGGTYAKTVFIENSSLRLGLGKWRLRAQSDVREEVGGRSHSAEAR